MDQQQRMAELELLTSYVKGLGLMLLTEQNEQERQRIKSRMWTLAELQKRLAGELTKHLVEHAGGNPQELVDVARAHVAEHKTVEVVE